jgi:imidazolonepropionase-like amidohydrolase
MASLNRLVNTGGRVFNPKTTSAILLLAVLTCGAFGRGTDLIVIRAGRLIDVEKGQVLTDQLIFVRAGRIERISASQGATVPPDGRVVDLSRYTVLPGLIDCHTHLIDSPTSSGAGAPLELSPAQMAFNGARNAKKTLLAGFTTVRDVGTYRAFVDVALRDAINDDVVIGPRMAVAGAYITVSSGGGDITGLSPDIALPPDMKAGIANSAVEVRQRVREILHRGADFIKIIATGAVLTRGTKPGVPEFREDEIRAAVEEADKYGAKVTAHAHGAEGIKMAIRAGVGSIEHGSLIDDEGIQLMKDRGIWLVADIYNGDYIASEYRRLGYPEEFLRKNDETTEAQRSGFRKAVAAGVRIAYGTDAAVYPHGENARQLPYMVKHGMAPMQAIQSATVNAARNIGWADKVGSISAGKLADIIAVEGDALADLTKFMNVAFVMKGGRIVKQTN